MLPNHAADPMQCEWTPQKRIIDELRRNPQRRFPPPGDGQQCETLEPHGQPSPGPRWKRTLLRNAFRLKWTLKDIDLDELLV